MKEQEKQSESVPTDEVPDYTTIVGLKRTKIAELVNEFNRIRKEIKLLETRKKDLAADGAKILIKASVKSVMVDGLRTTVIAGVSKRISGKKLYELGVSEKLIAKATSETPWTSLKVTEPGENGGGEE
jgi:hypothetical protein